LLKSRNLDPTGLCLDFFAGSGTTGHAVINLNREDGGRRKYILVEMGQHFHSVILPRLKKVIYSDKWKDGRPNGGQGVSHFFKYYRLEQYEETLRRASYRESTLFNNPWQTPYASYVFLRDEKLLEAVTVDIEADTVKVDLAPLYRGIDLAETLSNLHGWPIKRIVEGVVEFENGRRVELADPPWELVKPLVWW
jgi:adenine-specific DNA-methyltransferase